MGSGIVAGEGSGRDFVFAGVGSASPIPAAVAEARPACQWQDFPI
jgi:hypothetical protein